MDTTDAIVEQRLDRVEQRLEHVEQRLDRLDARLERQEQQIAALATEMAALRATIAAHIDAIGAHFATRADLHRELHLQTQRLVGLLVGWSSLLLALTYAIGRFVH